MSFFIICIYPLTLTSKALDDRIDEFSELIREHYNIPELGDPSASTEVMMIPGYPLRTLTSYS